MRLSTYEVPFVTLTLKYLMGLTALADMRKNARHAHRNSNRNPIVGAEQCFILIYDFKWMLWWSEKERNEVESEQ